MKTKYSRIVLQVALITTIVMGITSCNKIRGVESSLEYPADFWEEATPESQGIDSELLTDMIEYIDINKIDVHSIIVYRNETIPLEVYFGGYNKNISHNLKSTSKSYISALVGIAIDQGILNLDDKVYDFFPEYPINDPIKKEITIRHLLTMTAGLEWSENDLNSMYTFFVNGNIARRVLNLSLVDEPGTRFNYNTGLTHLLSAILAKASDMSTLQFAEEYLFKPLEIRNIIWETDRNGDYIGGSELFLTPRAMLKFGVLYLNGGQFNGQQLISREWIDVSTRTQIDGLFHGARVEYGYLWWLNIDNELFSYIDGTNAFVALGVHGQRIFVDPSHDTVVVITANQADESQCDILLRDFIVSAIGEN